MSQNKITRNNYDHKNSHINVNILLIIIETRQKYERRGPTVCILIF